MSERTERAGSRLPGATAASDTPFCVQLYKPPHLDLRYITTYMCNGDEIVCHSFPRRYSRRYIRSTHGGPLPGKRGPSSP
eukprot:5944714-Pyramimonas_sp.AAC.1